MDALTALCAIPLIFFARNNPWRPADAVTPACIILFSLVGPVPVCKLVRLTSTALLTVPLRSSVIRTSMVPAMSARQR